jgi:hypothetical protein
MTFPKGIETIPGFLKGAFYRSDPEERWINFEEIEGLLATSFAVN